MVGTIVLMHGVRANRLSMVRRAEMLHRAGYSVLLFDFQAHGESPGSHITMGYLESVMREQPLRMQEVAQRAGSLVPLVCRWVGQPLCRALIRSLSTR